MFPLKKVNNFILIKNVFSCRLHLLVSLTINFTKHLLILLATGHQP